LTAKTPKEKISPCFAEKGKKLSAFNFHFFHQKKMKNGRRSLNKKNLPLKFLAALFRKKEKPFLS
jgi:hypothetical protein